MSRYVVRSNARLNQSTHTTSRLTDDAALPDVSVIVPVFNEASRIERSLETLWRFFHDREEVAEILVVDDGSNDDTVSLAKSFATDHPNVCVLPEEHRGKAAAVLEGIQQARGHIVGFMDVDLATPLETWEQCKSAIEAGAGVAIASREGLGSQRVGEPWYRHAMGRIFNAMVRILLLPGIDDTQCGFKFFSRAAIDDIQPRQQLYRHAGIVSIPRVTAFDVELLYIARKHGHRIAVIPVTWQYGTQSKVNPITDTLQNVRDVLLVRFNGWRGRYDEPVDAR
jgi:glycosyltransferase involved in cell wall biosynthesis